MEKKPNPFDNFKTIGEVRGERRQPNPLSFWIIMTICAMIVGSLAGGGLYLAFEFRRANPRHGRRPAFQEAIPLPASVDVVKRRVKLCAMIGAVAGLLLGARWSFSAAARERYECRVEEERLREQLENDPFNRPGDP
jgi:hypothetical protein